jgi:prepilin-type N-terminal cleavage/methylation domain-containing protein
MSARRRRATGGFTLIEILVVIGIFGVVTAIGTSTFVSVTSAWNERKVIAELDAQAQLAIESIRQDVAAALSHEVAGVSLRGGDGEVQDGRTYPAAVHPDDDLSIPVQAVDPNAPLAVPANVGYRIERSGGTGVLVRTVGPLGAEFPTTNRLDLLPGAAVMGFSVEYLASGPGPIWVESWNGDGAPAAVRVSLSIQSLDRPNQFQVCRQAVIPVRVR